MLELHELDEITLELDGPKLLSGIATKTAAGLTPSALVRRVQELWSMHLQPLRGNYGVRNDKGKRRLNAPAEGTIRSLIHKRREGARAVLGNAAPPTTEDFCMNGVVTLAC